MSSRLPRDPHPRTTKKASASAAAVQLLLRRGGRAAAKDESIEFFSALRDCQPDPRVPGQTGIGPADRRGKARLSGGGTELLSTEIGKHDYDWLLTPPATPLGFPAATRGAKAALNRLTRATSASFAKSNSPLSLARRENGNSTSRLARSSSASATHSSSVNRPAFASSCRPSHVRTLSTASSSSINAASNASGRSTPLGSAATSPRTPATARSAAAASSPSRPQGKALARQVPSGSGSGSGAASQPKGTSSSDSGSPAPTIPRQPRAPTTGASSPKSTRVASEQPARTTRRAANAVARSRFASELSSAMSTAQPAQNVVRSSIVKPRPVPVAVKQCHGNGTAATNSTALTQSWLSSPFPSRSSAISASLSASRGDLLANKRSSWSGDYGRKINVDKVTAPRRTAGLASAATSSGLTRAGSRKSANAAVNEDLKPTVQPRSIQSSIASRSRLGFAATTSAAGTIARGRRATTQKGKVTAAAAAARVAEADAFPSTRYDAMLLQEDPKNLTWLNGCGDDDESSGVGLVEAEGSLDLEPFSVTVTGTNGTAA